MAFLLMLLLNLQGWRDTLHVVALQRAGLPWWRDPALPRAYCCFLAGLTIAGISS